MLTEGLLCVGLCAEHLMCVLSASQQPSEGWGMGVGSTATEPVKSRARKAGSPQVRQGLQIRVQSPTPSPASRLLNRQPAPWPS